MKKTGLFWGIYMLFFAIPFPMILYYSITGSEPQTAPTGPLLVKVYVTASVILWLICLYRLLKNWLLGVFTYYKRIRKLMAEGTLVAATVTDCVTAGPARKAGVEPLQVTLSFTNFSGTTISETLEINDSKPYEHRYDLGKQVDLRIDPELKLPCIMPDGTRVRLKQGTLLLRTIGLLALIAAITGYYLFSYQYEGRGNSWQFMIFWHPLIICPLMILFNTSLIGGLMKKYFGPGKNDLRLKLYGRKTIATLKSASQTGLSVNDQPQVLFVLEYTDDSGKKYQANFKKIVSLLELDITRKKELEIFYLPEAPHTIALAADPG